MAAAAHERIPTPGASRRVRAAEVGTVGERETAAVLDSDLPPGWTVLHGRRLLPDSPSDIDHLVVGPTGVWVIDTKNYMRCRIYGAALWRRDARVDLEPLRFAADRVQAILGVVARPVVCLVRQSHIDASLRDVRVVGLNALLGLLLDAPMVYEREVVDAFVAVIRRSLAPAGWEWMQARTGSHLYLKDENGRRVAAWRPDQGLRVMTTGRDPEVMAMAAVRGLPIQGELQLQAP